MSLLNDTERAIVEDKDAALAAIGKARANKIKTIELSPQSPVPAEVVSLCAKDIQPAERMRVILPRCFTHFGGEKIDWDTITEIQEDFRGPEIPKDVFVTLRFEVAKGDDYDEATNFVVDIYRVPV
jgi:hypothetical protein